MSTPADPVDRAIGRRRFLHAAGLAAGAVAAAPAAGAVELAAQEPRPAPGGPAGPAAAPRGGPSLSRQFSRWVAGLRYEDVPPAVVDRIKGLTLHALSSILLGSQMEGGREAAALVIAEESAVRNGATVMVNGAKATKCGAVFANAEMAQAAGKWDTFRMLTHPGISIFPSAFAAAETEGTSGRDFIAGVAAGYEVMERMASDFIPSVMAHGFHASSVFSIFGAAMVAARLMRLDEDQVNATFGHCVNMAGGNLESLGREGLSARNAMMAVALARLGHPATETILEGEAGFYYAYTGNNRGDLTYSFTGDRHANLNRITEGLGKDWTLLETLYRIYSISGYNIAHIDVTARLCEEHDIRYADVARVEAVVNWLETLYPTPAFPARHEAAKPTKRGNTPYFTAYGVVKRGYPMLPGTPDPPEVLELMNRVTIVPSHETGLFAPRITIFTKDGNSYTRQATGREFIWDFDEEVRRIRAVVPGLPIPAAQFEAIIETCRTLDRQERADRLVQLTLKPA
jgi:2-methylcitrate dehydratase PrpD